MPKKKCGSAKKGGKPKKGPNKRVETILPGYYTVQEAAEYFGVKENSIWHQISNGNLKAKRVGGRSFILARDVRTFSIPNRGNPGIGKTVKQAFSLLKKLSKDGEERARNRKAVGIVD